MTRFMEVGGSRSSPAPRGHGTTCLDLNEAPRELPRDFRDMFVDRVTTGQLRRYPDMDGRRARVAAASLYGWDEVGILVGNGSGDLLAAAMRALLPWRGSLATLEPSFPLYSILAGRKRARQIPVQLEPPGFSCDIEALLRAASRADLVLLNSPNNPTGTEVPVEGLVRLLEIGRPVLWDAAYVEFSGVEPSGLLRRFDNLLVLRTLSKAWAMAGVRAGALLGSPERIAAVREETLPFATGGAVAAAFECAAESPRVGRQLVEEVVAERERQMRAMAMLEGVDVVSSSANFYLLRYRGWPATTLAGELGARGFALRALPELESSGFVRVTVGSRVEGESLCGAVAEVIRA